MSRPAESRASTRRTRPVVQHWYGRFRNATADVTASAVARLEDPAELIADLATALEASR